MKNEIGKSVSKIRKEKKIKKIALLTLLILFFLLLIIFLIVGLIYNKGSFSISLDKNLYYEKNLIIYDNPDYKVYRSDLYAKGPETFDNISYKWLNNEELINHRGGSHNGDNYLAYTFYIENTGKDVSDYWYEVFINDVIKNVDKAVRIRIYRNGEYVTYAKASENGNPEKETVPFQNNEVVASGHVENFKPGNIDKYTIVLWLEGSDPDCNDNILGGEFKASMEFNSEFIDEKKE